MKEKRTEYLDEKLINYSKSDYYPFHMPGHKRSMRLEADPYSIDITEIDGFDNLHDAREVLLWAQSRAAALYGADESYYLVNGSTCGILAAVSAAVEKGGRLLMARNCHKAVYHAAYLRELQLGYLYPVITSEGIQGRILPEEVEQAFVREPGIRAVIITSPTYDGITSDIAEIAEIVHRHNGILIVDEAHGAHLGFHPSFPQTAVRLGADAVIQSMHKTLPSLTQTALLHLNTERIDRKKIKRFLSIYQTSSPSYVLMAGMERCVRMLETEGEERFAQYVARLEDFYHRAAGLQEIRVLQPKELSKKECHAFDPSKIIIRSRGGKLDGKQLYMRLLEDYHLQLELCSGDYTLAMTSLMDSQEGFERLFLALKEIDLELSGMPAKLNDKPDEKTDARTDMKAGDATEREIAVADYNFVRRIYVPNEKVLEISKAQERESTALPLSEAAGATAGDYVYLYPPGIPMLVPGERISEEIIANIRECLRLKLDVKGIDNLRINVVI